MKKSQNRIIKWAMELLNKGNKIEDIAKTVGVSKGTVSKWGRKYGNFTSNDGNFTSNDGNFTSNDGNFTSNDGNFTHKYKLVETSKHLVFADETGRIVTDHEEWKQAYNRAVDAGVILF